MELFNLFLSSRGCQQNESDRHESEIDRRESEIDRQESESDRPADSVTSKEVRRDTVELQKSGCLSVDFRPDVCRCGMVQNMYVFLGQGNEFADVQKRLQQRTQRFVKKGLFRG